MLPRRLLLEHSWLVAEALMLRHLTSLEKEALIQIPPLATKVIQLHSTIEELHQQRNNIATAYQRGQDRELLQRQGLALKEELNELEQQAKVLEATLSSYESQLPNVPGPGIDISYGTWERRGLLDLHLATYQEYCQAKQQVLRLLHHYLKSYNATKN